MKFPVASNAVVLNRGTAPESFLAEMVAWAKTAPADLFTVNPLVDIYSKVRPELGPYRSTVHRAAVMLEVMRVLAGFESSWDWTEGVDTSRLGPTTPENAEAGAWQVSYDARRLAAPLAQMLADYGIADGVTFQRATKFDRQFAMTFIARLLRHNTRHNGPLYKGDERLVIRKSLRDEKHSIYPWLNRKAVAEFERLLVA